MDGEFEGAAYGWTGGQKLALPYFIFLRNVSYISHSISLCINCIATFLFLSSSHPYDLQSRLHIAILLLTMLPFCMDVFLQSHMLNLPHVFFFVFFFSTIFKLCMYGKRGSRQKAMMISMNDVSRWHRRGRRIPAGWGSLVVCIK
ncbi:hypothetical protein GE21DRAFT_1107598 [Neurospora crassa]|nr:hypothetical protein GE21DRAFT_1107598 [Neurospora crassa]